MTSQDTIKGISDNYSVFNEPNQLPHPNIINAAELKLDLLPLSINHKLKTNSTLPKAKTEPIEHTAKTTDRSKAKAHIAAQHKRRLSEKKTVESSDKQKDEIKKRLEALHKSSQKIVKKNVAKHRNEKLNVANPTPDNIDTNKDKCVASASTVANSLTNDRKKPIVNTNLIEKATSKTEDLLVDLTPSKRGILRRNEQFDKPPSKETEPHLDKALISSLLENVQKRKSVSKESTKHESNAASHLEATPPLDVENQLKIPQSEFKSSVLNKNSKKSRSRSWESLRSSSSTNKRLGSIRGDVKVIPYWLKPSSSHIYPYNFIMAVRKKLESVTQPTLVDPVQTDTPLARPKSSRNIHSSNFRTKLDKPDESSVTHTFLKMIDSIQPFKTADEKLEKLDKNTKSPGNNVSESKPLSGSEEFSTNFSSISLHITDRNTMSELSSIHSEQVNHPISSSKISQQIDETEDDDTTISSAILSQSPEKKSKRRELVVQPLSTEGIKDLKMSSSNLNVSLKPSLHPFINTSRGDSLESDSICDLDQRSMNEMFETFSKNLSQVISVNERLHSALSRSNRKNSTSVRENSSEVKSYIVPEKSSISEVANSYGAQKRSNITDKMETEPVYTTTFETSHESIQEVSSMDSRTKIEKESKNDEDSEETVKDLLSTKTVSEQQPGSVLVTTTIDTQTVTSRKTEILSNIAPTDSVRRMDPELRRQSNASSMIGSDIFAVFSQSDEENSLRSVNQITSEESFNYSTIGMFDQLINHEKQKSEHLSKLMKIREKSLIDRTKGQIAWLELQKQKYKEKGLTDRISAVKKKQRALLMHMAAEQANIMRLSKLQNSPKSQRSSSKFKFQNFSAAEVNVRRCSIDNDMQNNSQRSAFRAYEINGTNGLEGILKKREEELQKRRSYVEHLIKWHQRLNREEDELLALEKILMTYTSTRKDNVSLPSNCSSRSPRKMPREMKKIENIEKSLQLLHDMSSTSVTSNGNEIEDVVEASGKRLNKLWRRLTGENTDKFNVDEHYKLNKFDLEKMYEDAKSVVIHKFSKHKDIGSLIDQSQSIVQLHNDPKSEHYEEETNLMQIETDESYSSVIPSLDLNFLQDSKTDSITPLLERNKESERSNDDFYFNDEDIPNKVNTINNQKLSIESDQDNTHADADAICFDNNSLSSQSSLNEKIEEISFPNFKDVTSFEHSTLNNLDDNHSFNDSVDEKLQTTSPTISDNVVMEFNDNELSDEYEKDNTTDKSLQLQQSSSDDESKRVTISNQTMLSNTELGEEDIIKENNHMNSSDELRSIGLEQRLIDLDDSLKELSETIDRAPVMGNRTGQLIEDNRNSGYNNDDECPRSTLEEKFDVNEIKIVRNKIINETFPTTDLINASKHDELYHFSGKNTSIIRDYVSPAGELKMPDIISEAEVLRRQQLQIEQEIKHLDPTVPVVFIREIPNKPPPPYVPPSPDSPIPMTPIPPTDERIKEIVYWRINELYNTHILDTPTEKSQSILTENVTNIFERIILDVCKECIIELEIDSSSIDSMKFKQRLAFHNLQEFALKKVKKLLDPSHCGMGISTQIGTYVKRKRDLVDQMLVMEMVEDDSKWSNFDLEEKEVIENIVEQIVLLLVNDAVDDAVNLRRSKTSALTMSEVN